MDGSLFYWFYSTWQTEEEGSIQSSRRNDIWETLSALTPLSRKKIWKERRKLPKAISKISQVFVLANIHLAFLLMEKIQCQNPVNMKLIFANEFKSISLQVSWIFAKSVKIYEMQESCTIWKLYTFEGTTKLYPKLFQNSN